MNIYKTARAIITSTRKFILAHLGFIIRFYYRNFWSAPENTVLEFIDTYSKSVKNLFFIQVGSNDGFQNDLLYKFIIRDNWKGIMIEPQPKPYKILSYIYKKRNIITLNSAIDNKTDSRKLFKIGVSDLRWASGLSSFEEEKIKALIANKRVLRKCKKEGIKLPLDPETFVAYDEVSCISFEKLISTYEVSKIDLLQIDTEGYDYELLKQFNFSQIKPNAVIFENVHLSEADKAAANELLKAQGYTVVEYTTDTLAKLPDQQS
ncbi:FkbM family methyltransferase [Bacteroidota bacterium]